MEGAGDGGGGRREGYTKVGAEYRNVVGAWFAVVALETISLNALFRSKLEVGPQRVIFWVPTDCTATEGARVEG